MNFTVSRSSLLPALEVANKAVSTSAITPILNSFLFKIKSNELKVCASNQELFITKTIEIFSEIEAFNLAIPAARLLGLVRDLTEQTLSIAIGETNVVITAESGNYTIPFQPGEDFPEMDITGECLEMLLPSTELTAAIEKTNFAAATETNSKTYGLCLDVSTAGLTITGATMASLSTQTLPCLNETERRILLPPRTAVVLSQIEKDAQVKIQAYTKNISFEINGTEIRSIILDLQYPNYLAIIPTQNPVTIKAKISTFLSATKRVIAFSNKEHMLLKILIAAGVMRIIGEDVSFGENGTEEFTVEHTGEDVSLTVKGDCLFGCLQHCEGEDVYFFINDHKSAMVIRSVDHQGEKCDLMLLSPYL